jgi:hypothetical protein
MRNSFLMLGAVILLAGCGDGGLGGFPQVYPEAPEGKKFVDVLGAAEAVVKEHYPMAATSIRSQHILALGKVGILGGAKSQKQVSVWIRKTYTGHWKPEVTIRLLTQVNEPRSGASDPSSVSVPRSRPIAGSPEWQTLQTCPVEEVKLSEAIYARLNG